MLGDKWKNLSETQRKPYDEKAAADKKRYEEEKKIYQVCPQPQSSRNFHANRSVSSGPG